MFCRQYFPNLMKGVRMIAMIRPAAALSLALLLAGCTGTPVTIDSTSTADYNLSLVAYGAKSGEVAAEIHGQPFAAPVPSQTIARAAPMPPWSAARTLTAQPGPGTPRNYRVVLTFNPAERSGVSNACIVSRPPIAPPDQGMLRVSADYCAFDRSLSHLVASAPAASGPDDPRFRDLMAVVLAHLLPATDPNNQPEGCHSLTC